MTWHWLVNVVQSSYFETVRITFSYLVLQSSQKLSAQTFLVIISDFVFSFDVFRTETSSGLSAYSQIRYALNVPVAEAEGGLDALAKYLYEKMTKLQRMLTASRLNRCSPSAFPRRAGKRRKRLLTILKLAQSNRSVARYICVLYSCGSLFIAHFAYGCRKRSIETRFKMLKRSLQIGSYIIDIRSIPTRTHERHVGHLL